MVAGPMELDPTVGPIALPAGTYWIMAIFSAGASVGRADVTGNLDAYQYLAFGAALPHPFGAALTYSGDAFNYYLVVE
jgi:hypothetical protein